MSMCGELENLDHEINQAKIKLESLAKRRNDLATLIDPDPDKRDWEYDGYGVRRDKDNFQPVVSNLGKIKNHLNFHGINRFEVIDSRGRSFVAYEEYDVVEVHLQDGSKTMKVFLR